MMIAWGILLDELLRGLVHSINNRVATIGAYADLAVMDGEALEPDLVRPELARLQEANAMIGKLAERSERVEALEVRPLLELAIRMYDTHGHVNPPSCVVRQDAAVLPVRVLRWALLRLLLLMVRAACRDRKQVAYVRIDGDDEVVRITLESADEVSAEGIELAAICGGALRSNEIDIILELPTLPALKRRELTS